MKKSLIKRYVTNKYIIAGFVVLVVVGYFVFSSGNNSVRPEYAEAVIDNIIEKVSVTGKVLPSEKADLAFEKSGVISLIKFKVGDVVKKGEVIASLDSAQDKAQLASAKAKLEDMTRSLRPQELSVEQSKVDAAKVTLNNAQRDASNSVRTSYVQVQNAIFNYADTLFNNPQSVNPTIKFLAQSQNEERIINSMRLTVSEYLNKWQADLSPSAISDDPLVLISNVEGYQKYIKLFMDELSSVVNDLNPGSSGLSQATIDSYLLTINTAMSALNQSIITVSTAKTTLVNAVSTNEEVNNSFVLKNSGSSPQAVAAQSASVDSYRAELSKDNLVSPIDGVLIRKDSNVGEFVSAGKSSFAVISSDGYKIEAYIPEADIARISIGNIASTTLDAYGQYVDFPATVILVDPAETIIEGVPTYKVTLNFLQNDERIRSGMTANLEIITNERYDVISVPNRAVIDDLGQKSVRLLNSDGKTFKSVNVVTGLKGSDGKIEIISGLEVGDKVVTYIN